MTVDLGAVAPRSFGAPRRLWGLALLALAIVVIAGMLSMHGFSAGHHAPALASLTAGSAADSVTHTTDHTALATPEDGIATSCPAGDCDDSMTMLCLFVLLTLILVLAGRLGRDDYRAGRVLDQVVHQSDVSTRPSDRPRTHARRHLTRPARPTPTRHS